MLGLVSKIQDYSTKDGPGIRTTVFMIGCNLKCKWCANPETISTNPKIMYHKQKCKLCGKCCEVVSNNSIIIKDNKLNINFDSITNIDEVIDCCPYDAYEKIGFKIDSKELVNKLLMNKVFYQQSGGGVTFSGGEALLQSEFIDECINILHQYDIHVAIDTAGNIDQSVFNKITNKADLILYDIKTFNSELHKYCTNVTNKLILTNYLNIKSDVIVRLIIVPGYNDNLDDIKKRVDFAIKNKNLKQIDILPYHSYGEGKYEALGIPYLLANTKSCDDNLIASIITYIYNKGVFCTVGGN